MKKMLLSLLCATGFAATQAGTVGNVNVNPETGITFSNVRVSQAYDGTFYMSRLGAFDADPTNKVIWEILKSANGVSWTPILLDTLTGTKSFRAADICAAGGTASNFKLFIAGSIRNSATDSAELGMFTIDPSSGSPIDFLADEFYFYSNPFNRGYDQIVLASDWRQPASGDAPYSISLAVEKSGAFDSVIAFTDASAGTSLHRKSYYGTVSYIHSLSMAVGSIHRRFYPMMGITWGEASSFVSDLGTMYVQLADADDGTTASPGDGLYTMDDVTGVYTARHPSIAISQTNIATDTGKGGVDYRVTLAWENIGPGGNSIHYVSHDSFINAPAALNFNYYGDAPADTTSEFFPVVVYDPYYSQFDFSWYDAINEKMPLRTQNLSTPPLSLLNAVSDNYRTATTPMTNDVSPCLLIDPISHSSVYSAWNDMGASFFTAIVVPEGVAAVTKAATVITIFPNPATDRIMISFAALKTGTVQINIVDMSGRSVAAAEASVTAGNNEIPVALGNLAPGNYAAVINGNTAGAATFTVK